MLMVLIIVLVISVIIFVLVFCCCGFVMSGIINGNGVSRVFRLIIFVVCLLSGLFVCSVLSVIFILLRCVLNCVVSVLLSFVLFRWVFNFEMWFVR